MPLVCVPLGDSAVTVRLGGSIDDAVHQRVLAFIEALRSSPFPGMTEAVGGYHVVTVFYDPVVVRRSSKRLLAGTPPAAAEAPPSSSIDVCGTSIFAQVCEWLNDRYEAAEGGAYRSRSRLVKLPVCYGGEWGPDLEEVSRHCRLAPEEVIALHSGADYTIYMIGFAPGFPYMGGLPERLATPRRETPRVRVAAGSVGIGGGQTGVYPLETPGGWQLIGRTPLSLFRPDREPPVLLAAGDRVRFVPVSEECFRELEEGGESAWKPFT